MKKELKIKSCFFDNYDSNVANLINQSQRNIIVSDKNKLNKFIVQSFDSNINNALHLGIINQEVIKKLKSKVKNLPLSKKEYIKETNYDLVINQSEIRHLKDKKVKLTITDICNYINKIQEIILNFDSISYDIQKDEGLRFKKKIKDEVYIAFIILSNKKRTLKIKTIYMSKFNYEQKKKHISTD